MERWKEIEGYEGLYWISSYGRVYSVKRKKILKPWKESGGYLKVCLHKDGTKEFFKVHRIVLFTFRPGAILDGGQCNHRNGCKTDNRLENIECCSARENILHSKRILGETHSTKKKAG